MRHLDDSQTNLLVTQLLGADSSVGGLCALVAQRAAGNPFFVEEMVRDLAERGVLQGHTGAFQLRGRFVDAAVPATLQATIGARIDRLGATAKKTLNAAAVIGTRFAPKLLGRLIDGLDLEALTAGEFVSEVPSSSSGDYAFCHPLIRTVAYESQLKSDRAQLHRLLAAHLEEPESADENASLIAGHLEAAGDLSTAFGWHMRAGAWYNYRAFGGTNELAQSFFGRRGGVSKEIFTSLNCGPGSGDERANVIQNRMRVADTLMPDATLLTLYQIHSATRSP